MKDLVYIREPMKHKLEFLSDTSYPDEDGDYFKGLDTQGYLKYSEETVIPYYVANSTLQPLVFGNIPPFSVINHFNYLTFISGTQKHRTLYPPQAHVVTQTSVAVPGNVVLSNYLYFVFL